MSMSSKELIKLLFTHPLEFRTLLQYKIWYEPKRDISAPSEHATSGWHRESMRTCWGFLDKTSRSFAAVIKELDGDLARVICLFYLALRGLDTIEDDMTIPLETKEPLLRAFGAKLSEEGWSFDGCGPDEKDRELLVQWPALVEEFNRMDKGCQEVIADIAHKMGNGMADYAAAAARGQNGVDTIPDFDLYCHFVAGLVGEGLSRLFVATGKERSLVGEQLELSNSMGLFLQKTNILRDYREDVDVGREFWPAAIWRAQGFASLAQLKEPENEEKALWVVSGMVLDALRHATDCLDYLSLLKNQSVFAFCAIPQVHAIATIELCFMNREILHRNVKIRKASAVDIMMNTRNPRDVAYKFQEYARKIHSRMSPADPYYVKLSIALGKIEQWCEHHYPSFIQITGGTPSMDTSDARHRTMEYVKEKAAEREREAILAGRTPQPRRDAAAPEQFPWLLLAGFMAAFLVLMGILGVAVWFGVQWIDNLQRKNL